VAAGVPSRPWPRQWPVPAGAPAQLDQLPGCRRLGIDPAGAEYPAEQVEGVGRGEHVQRQRDGTVDGNQSGQLVTACHDDQAAGAARQQGPDLGGVGSIIEHDQCLLACHDAAIEPRLCVRAVRDTVGRDLEGIEKHPDRVGSQHRRQRRVEAAQVHVQLPVRKRCHELAGNLERQRGLADARQPADRSDHHGLPALLAGLILQAGQPGQLGGATGEVPALGWQLPGHDRGRMRPRGAGRRRSSGLSGEFLTSGEELGPGPAAQVQGIGQAAQRIRVGPSGTAALEVTDSTDAEPGCLGQLRLGQPGRPPPGAQHPAERQVTVSHLGPPERTR
jgi:hypothetical protein